MPLPVDIDDYLARHFAPDEATRARALLEVALMHDGTRPPPRCLRAAAVGARGSFASLARLVDLLAVDFRDVIVSGEYETQGNQLVRVRDLNQVLAADA